MSDPRYPAQAFAAGQGDPVPRHRCNPRRAYDREGREIRPMDLANAAQNGVRSIRASDRRIAQKRSGALQPRSIAGSFEFLPRDGQYALPRLLVLDGCP